MFHSLRVGGGLRMSSSTCHAVSLVRGGDVCRAQRPMWKSKICVPAKMQRNSLGDVESSSLNDRTWSARHKLQTSMSFSVFLAYAKNLKCPTWLAFQIRHCDVIGSELHWYIRLGIWEMRHCDDHLVLLLASIVEALCGCARECGYRRRAASGPENGAQGPRTKCEIPSGCTGCRRRSVNLSLVMLRAVCVAWSR